ncbi:transcription factor TGA2.2-like isoform X2 [Ananas comosus]|uniref:Transcription factor TGA2.2-like isoform X2 n=1 Tax=Ananas comosus TaxID=4615 RepID=A0A6P5GR52_ANACO|nr:transcription factor TGA2.2-like isoform X2 [Ananas comosus]
MGSRRGGIGVEDGKGVVGGMPSFSSTLPGAQTAGTEGNKNHPASISEFGTILQSTGFRSDDAGELGRCSAVNINSTGQTVTFDLAQFASLTKQAVTSTGNTPSLGVDFATLPRDKGSHPKLVSISSGHFENWGESAMADASPRTDTSTDVDTDERNRMFEQGQTAALVPSDSSDRSKDKSDQKTLRRLAQNREAARKSRLRKKAYVQQLENSRLKLNQLEQELQRARQQGIFISSSGDHSHSTSGNGALVFNTEYGRWLEDHNRQINELRTAVNAHASDTDLRAMVEGVMAHYDEIFRLKGIAAKADVFHMLSGMWKTPAERCFLWLGGFRSSELLKLCPQHSAMSANSKDDAKLLVTQLEPLTEQQVVGLCSLQQSSQQAEDALSQGMEALQQSLAETLAGSLGPSGSSGNVANYMGQMAMAMGKLGTLENFLRQADNLRQQTLQQMQRILTIRQSARALLAIHDYFSRLRALSSLWLARPRDLEPN